MSASQWKTSSCINQASHQTLCWMSPLRWRDSSTHFELDIKVLLLFSLMLNKNIRNKYMIQTKEKKEDKWDYKWFQIEYVDHKKGETYKIVHQWWIIHFLESKHMFIISSDLYCNHVLYWLTRVIYYIAFIL